MKIERKKNEETKGQISSSSLIQIHTIHLPTVHVCTRFQPSRPHSSSEKCDEKVWCLKIGEKEKWKIKGWVSSSSSLIPIYTIHLLTVHVCAKFQPSWPHNFWEKCDKKIKFLKIGEKEKWRNKGTTKQQQPEYSIHNTSVHCPRVCQISIF